MEMESEGGYERMTGVGAEGSAQKCSPASCSFLASAKRNNVESENTGDRQNA